MVKASACFISPDPLKSLSVFRTWLSQNFMERGRVNIEILTTVNCRGVKNFQKYFKINSNVRTDTVNNEKQFPEKLKLIAQINRLQCPIPLNFSLFTIFIVFWFRIPFFLFLLTASWRTVKNSLYFQNKFWVVNFSTQIMNFWPWLTHFHL